MLLKWFCYSTAFNQHQFCGKTSNLASFCSDASSENRWAITTQRNQTKFYPPIHCALEQKAHLPVDENKLTHFALKHIARSMAHRLVFNYIFTFLIHNNNNNNNRWVWSSSSSFESSSVTFFRLLLFGEFSMKISAFHLSIIKVHITPFSKARPNLKVPNLWAFLLFVYMV